MTTSGVALGIHGQCAPSSKPEEQPVVGTVLESVASGQLVRALAPWLKSCRKAVRSATTFRNLGYGEFCGQQAAGWGVEGVSASLSGLAPNSLAWLLAKCDVSSSQLLQCLLNLV